VCLAVKHPSGAQDQTDVSARQLRNCSCGAPSQTRGRVRRSQMLLAFASALIFTAVKISSTCHLYLQFYTSAFYTVVKSPVPCGHLIFTVLHVTLVCIGVGQNNRNTTDTIHISLLICSWTTFCLQYSCSPSCNVLLQVWRVSRGILYHSSRRTCSSCFRDGGVNVFLTPHSSLHDWTVPAVWMGHCRLGKLHHCLEITFGSWDAPGYPTCPHTPLQ
jgi:hypothetical protein